MKQLFWFAVLHFVVLKAVEGIIFFVSHTPPKAVNLEVLEAVLVHVEDVLKFPRWLIIKLWPWETTPRGLGLALTTIRDTEFAVTLARALNDYYAEFCGAAPTRRRRSGSQARRG